MTSFFNYFSELNTSIFVALIKYYLTLVLFRLRRQLKNCNRFLKFLDHFFLVFIKTFW